MQKHLKSRTKRPARILPGERPHSQIYVDYSQIKIICEELILAMPAIAEQRNSDRWHTAENDVPTTVSQHPILLLRCSAFGMCFACVIRNLTRTGSETRICDYQTLSLANKTLKQTILTNDRKALAMNRTCPICEQTRPSGIPRPAFQCPECVERTDFALQCLNSRKIKHIAQNHTSEDTTELVRASPKYSTPQRPRPNGRKHLIRTTSQGSSRPFPQRARLRKQPENGSEDGLVHIFARTSGLSSDSVDGNQNVYRREKKRKRVFGARRIKK